MRTRLGLKVLGLSALLMGAMAIGTSAAQATTGAGWCYWDKFDLLLCASNSDEPVVVIALENNTGTLLIANVNLEVLCTSAALVEGGQLAANGSILLGRAEFSGCISLSKTPTLTKLNSCTPKDPVTGLGKIRTEKGTGLIVLHNGEPVVELKPDSGTTLAKIFLGEECAVSEELIVTGKLILHDASGSTSFKTHKVVHLFREFPSLKLMKVGVNEATLDGTANISLGGAHNGLEWCGLAV